MFDTCDDNLFGPLTNNCHWGWDFTLLFENAALSILPSSLLLFAVAVRIFYLRGKFQLVSAREFQLVKLGGQSYLPTIAC